MHDSMDAEIARAIERGERNAETISLIKRHCRHARIEHSRFHGVSMVEEMTGLPISVREMRCEYAPTPNAIPTDLLEGAVRFYKNNCDGCPHREAQGLPNLKTVAEQELAKQDQARRQQDDEERQRKQAEIERASRRAEAVSGESQGTRKMVALLDGIDCEKPDGRADGLIDLCRLQPELCTSAAAEVMLDTAEQTKSDALFGALLHLDRADRLPRRRLLEVALRALSTAALGNAATAVTRLAGALKAGDLAPTVFSAMRLDAPPHDFGLAPVGDPTLLRLLAKNDLPTLLDEMVASIKSELYRRRIATGAAARLIDFEPAVAGTLLGPLIDALSLPDALSVYMGEGRDELLTALSASFAADPEAGAALIEDRAVGLSEEVRSALLSALDSAMREGRRGEGDPEVSRAVIDFAFRRLAGDWGDEVAFEAATLIKNTTEWEPEAMEGRVDQLFGALLAATAAPVKGPSPLEVADDKPPILRAMEEQNQQIHRDAVIRELREALGSLAIRAPEAAAETVFTVIEAPEIDSEQGLELYEEAVWLLGKLGRRPALAQSAAGALERSASQ